MTTSFENLESYIACTERESKSIKPQLQWAYNICKKPVLETVKAVKDKELSNQKSLFQQLLDKKSLLEGQEAEAKEQLAVCQKALLAQGETAAQAKQTFEEYHERFCQAENAVQILQQKIEDLGKNTDAHIPSENMG